MPTAETLAEVLRPLTERPDRAGILLDVDGTLAPIVERAEEAHVPEAVSRLLAGLAGRYRCVACISGRSAAEARRLVGVGRLAYAGAHGAELLEPGGTTATILPTFDSWTERVREFAAAREQRELRRVRIRIEDKGPIAAFHWRGAPDEDAARAVVAQIAEQAEAAGFATHWGRKVLEVRPPVQVDKGQAVRELARRCALAAALYAGDDVTDLDAFEALTELVDSGQLEAAVRIGVESEEGPRGIVDRADLVVDGTAGVTRVLETLAG